jgi:hypothetical protein
MEMRKNLKWLIGAAVAGLLVLAIAIPVLAAGPNGANRGTSTQTGQPAYGNGNCQGLGAGINEAVTELLGMTREQVQEQRREGKSLVQIAADKNVTEEALIDAIMAGKQEAVQKLVADGTITQAQADQRLAQMRERVQIAISRIAVGPPDWAGGNGNGQKGTGNGNGRMKQAGPKGDQRNYNGNYSGDLIRQHLRLKDRSC